MKFASKEEFDTEMVVVARRKGVRLAKDRPSNGQVSDWSSYDLVLATLGKNVYWALSIYYASDDWQCTWHFLKTSSDNENHRALAEKWAFSPDNLPESNVLEEREELHIDDLHY